MTTARYDGAHLAPAARLRGHGSLRRALERVISVRQQPARRAVDFRSPQLDDAMLATYGSDQGELERVGQSCFPF